MDKNRLTLIENVIKAMKGKNSSSLKNVLKKCNCEIKLKSIGDTNLITVCLEISKNRFDKVTFNETYMKSDIKVAYQRIIIHLAMCDMYFCENFVKEMAKTKKGKK
jgi:hypothetical protein